MRVEIVNVFIFFFLLQQIRGGNIADMNIYQGYSRCELYPNGTIRALLTHAFNGENFLSLDLESKTYVASSNHALVYKRLRENDRIRLEFMVSFYKTTCFDRLKLFLQDPAVTVQKDVDYVSWHFMGSQGFSFPSYMERMTVNGHRVFYHDNNMNSALPCPSWLNTTAGQQHWEETNSITHVNRDQMAIALKTSIQQFNLTGNIADMNIYQGYSRCELYPNGITRALSTHAFNGEDFLSLDLESKTYIAFSNQALLYKQLRENDRILLEITVSFYKTTCFDRLKLFLQDPAVTVQKVPHVQIFESQRLGSTLLTCHVTGFHPRALQVRWIGADLQPVDEGMNEILPNNDGTYQIRRSVLRPERKSGDQIYSCEVKHVSKNITVPWAPEERFRLAVWIPLIFIFFTIVGLFCYFCKNRGGMV